MQFPRTTPLALSDCASAIWKTESREPLLWRAPQFMNRLCLMEECALGKEGIGNKALGLTLALFNRIAAVAFKALDLIGQTALATYGTIEHLIKMEFINALCIFLTLQIPLIASAILTPLDVLLPEQALGQKTRVWFFDKLEGNAHRGNTDHIQNEIFLEENIILENHLFPKPLDLEIPVL